jgi:hypothetical protein
VKKCIDCKTEKPLEAFSKDKHTSDGLRSRCRACASVKWKAEYNSRPEFWREKSRKWGKDNPEKKKKAVRDASRKISYGITGPEFEALLAKQEGKCAICCLPVKEGRGAGCAHVDHDHKTGKVRGILCHGCNTGLGCFKDSPVLLLSAADYLRKFTG